MSDVITLAAQRRSRAGKGGARESRRAGLIPAIVYGGQQPPLMIALDGAQLGQQLRRAGFMTHVYEIDVSGAGRERVLPREVQSDPVSGRPLHVDFMRVSATTEVTLAVQVRFENEDRCPGLKKGGVLNVALHEIEVSCRPDAIPDAITVDLAGLELGDVVHLDDVALPLGVTIAGADPKATVASIAAPTAEVITAELSAEIEAEST